MIEGDQEWLRDDDAAREKLESLRWPQGVVCPRCGEPKRIYLLGHIRRGLRKCGRCRKQFTVRTATLFESSHIPLHKWLQAVRLSGNPLCRRDLPQQLERALALEPKTALVVSVRLRGVSRLTEMRLLASPHGDAARTQTTDQAAEGALTAFELKLIRLMNARTSRPQMNVRRKKLIKRRQALKRSS